MKEHFKLKFLESGANFINKYLEYVHSEPDKRIIKTENDEQEMINVLTGLGGLIEYNVRAEFQHFSKKTN